MSIPTFQMITPGGDMQLLSNFEYRIPIIGPVTLAPFVDAGVNKILRASQLTMEPSRVGDLNNTFPQAGYDGRVRIAPGTQKPRVSTGVELRDASGSERTLPSVLGLQSGTAGNIPAATDRRGPVLVSQFGYFYQRRDQHRPARPVVRKAVDVPVYHRPDFLTAGNGRNMVGFSHLGVLSLKKNSVVLTAFAGLAILAHAQAPAPAAVPTRVATIQVQAAILSTGDGKKAQNDLTTKFNSRKQALEKKQSDIQGLQEQLKRGSATMNQDARDKLARDIDAGQRALKYDGEEFEADVQQEENKIMGDLGQKMMDIIIKYATQQGFAMVIDISPQQTPVLWADPSADITQEIIKLYDQAHPAGAVSAPSAP